MRMMLGVEATFAASLGVRTLDAMGGAFIRTLTESGHKVDILGMVQF